MRKFLIALALVATPAFAQQQPEEEINYYARDFPSFAEADRGSAVERNYNEYIRASERHAKALAACKSCNQPPVVRVEGTINVNVRITHTRRKPR